MLQFSLKILFIFLISLNLSSCVTPTDPKFSEISSSVGKADPNVGRIYIYRLPSLDDSLPSVKLNGEVVGIALPNRVFHVDREPGNYKIEISTEVDRHLSLILKKGQTKYVRLNVSMGFFVAHISPELMDNDAGEREIQQLNYYIGGGYQLKPGEQ